MAGLKAWRNGFRPFVGILLAAGLAAAPYEPAIAASGKTSVDYYIETYGTVDPELNPKALVARTVFDRLRAAADKTGRRTPRLVIIDGATNAWAIALPSGHIVLSRKGLELCFKNADRSLAETRLAFILGHELAHLAHDDYWHDEVEQFLARAPDTRRIAHFLDQSFEAREAELAADDKGYLYAAMAGYPVARLLATAGKEDFFSFWMKQTQSRVTSSHPFPEDRAALLRERLRMLQEKVTFFDMGVRLAFFGRCEDGMYFLKAFQQVFPGPSVLNNLGVCALQLARRAMPVEQAGFYWLPFLLDVDTRAPRVRGAAGALPGHRFLKEFEISSSRLAGYLRDAEEYLNRAVNMAPDYLPARLNLATVQLYLGRPHQARATLAAARAGHGDDWQLRMLDAIALYEQSDVGVDLWPAAVERLESHGGDMPLAWRYNLARLLELRPRRQDAGLHWRQLAEMRDRLPPPVRKQVCDRVPRKAEGGQCGKETASASDEVLPPWKWPLTSPEPVPLTPGMRGRLFAGWESIPFDWYRAKLYGFIHRAPDHQAEVMEMDQFIQLQVTRGGLPGDTASLSRLCPRPPFLQRTLRGEVYGCGRWAVLVRDRKPVEAWLIAP